jgi:pimeloyl-ACP methyl ester carboxylesterase
MLEPYQPGKIPVIFVHGLYDTPYTFTDLMNSLRSTPGFLDRYQIVGYRYATGLTFLHSAALFRRDLHRFEAAFDPSQSDPGLQNAVLLGHSMGGLLIKLQIVSSGRALWNLVANRPLESLVASAGARAFLADLFFFEPVPFVRRVLFLATPHDGLGIAAQPGGVISERLTRRPEDLRALVPRLDRDNPGAIRPYMRGLPNSIGMLRRREPIHQAMRRLPVDPDIRLHTIAGTAKVPAAIAHGDGAVPIASARHPGAESETLVPEFHATMNSSEYTLVEVDRILRRHAATAPVRAR